MSLTPPQKVQKLQAALHDKAKAAPGYPLPLYARLYRADILKYALVCCRSNGGAPGVDGETFEDIKACGEDRWLEALAEELRTKTYRASAVRRVWIPKPDGNQRPLGIPTIRDRVVQTAAVIVLGPIFEADLQPEQYAYRPERSALGAVEAVNGLLQRGYTEVVDADLSGYFDTIPHADLMKSVTRRVSDRNRRGRIDGTAGFSVRATIHSLSHGTLNRPCRLRLIKLWLEAPVEERDERGRVRRTTRNKDEGRGTPQGGVLSPLLANLYMRRFVLGWKTLGFAGRFDARIVNYADDFVICTRRGRADEVMTAMRWMMGELRLTVNETKTRVCRLPDETFDFPGYTFGRQYSPRTGASWIGPKPSKRKVQSVCRDVSEMLSQRSQWLIVSVAAETVFDNEIQIRSLTNTPCVRTTGKDVRVVIRDLNLKLRGWSNYFRVGTVVRSRETVMKHTRRRLRWWLCRKHKIPGGGYARFPNGSLHSELGLFLIPGVRSGLPCANS